MRDFDRILQAVADEYGLTMDDIRSTTRTHTFRLARRAAVLLAREQTSMSRAEIGAALGGRDQATIEGLERKARQSDPNSPRFSARVQRIRERLAADELAAKVAETLIPAKPIAAKPAPKQREGGVYFIKTSDDETWEGSWNGWGDIPDDHGRLEWTDRADAVEALRALRTLVRLEGGKKKLALRWSRRSKNTDMPHHSRVNEARFVATVTHPVTVERGASDVT